MENIEERKVTREEMPALITSKSFKERLLAYNNIKEFPEFINHLQNETLTIAIETALDVLLDNEVTSDNIENVYNFYGQTKVSIKSKVSELIGKVFVKDPQSVFRCLSQFILHKNTKISTSCIKQATSLISTNLEYFKKNRTLITENLLPKLEALFNSTDKDIKNETHELCIILYSIIYDEIFPFIENIKPILLNSLKESFDKVETPQTEMKITDLDFDSSNWKERLKAINFLKENIRKMTNANEYYNIIARKIRDLNINVVLSAVETLKNGEVHHIDCIRASIERFKDKKAALTMLIKDALLTIKPEISIYSEYLASGKTNNEIKCGILDVLTSYLPHINPLIKDIGKLLEDSSPDVRSKSASLLINLPDLSALTEIQRAKLSKPRHVNETSQPILAKSSENSFIEKTMDSSPRKSLLASMPSQSMVDYNLDQNERTRILDYFNSTYPFFQLPDWNKKLNAIRENYEILQKEKLENIALYLLSSKESNLQIVNEMLNLFVISENEIPSLTIFYIISKITEIKLKGNFIAILKRFKNKDWLNKAFAHHLNNNKTGKRCVCLFELWGFVTEEKSRIIDSFVQNFSCLGMIEKNALADFKKKYASLADVSQSVSITDAYTKPDIGVALPRTPIHPKFTAVTYLEPSVIPQVSSSVPINNCKVFNNNKISSNFIDLFNSDINRAVSLLESTHLTSVYDILQLYCNKELPSPYFNSLILNLIGKKYILKKNEASLLVNYLILKDQATEFEMVDRIYPATKLFLILKENLNGVRFSLKLLAKYSKVQLADLEGSLALIETIYEKCDDFISYSTQIESVLEMRNNLKKNYEEEYQKMTDNFIKHEFSNLSIHSTPVKKKSLTMDEYKEYHGSFVNHSFINAPENVSPILEDPFLNNNSHTFSSDIRDSFMDDNEFNLSINNSFMSENELFINNIVRKKAILKDEIPHLTSTISSLPNYVIKHSNEIINVIIYHLSRNSDQDQQSNDLLLDCILNLSQNNGICLVLDYNTLLNLHTYLIEIPHHTISSADILINLCLSCNLDILTVYYSLIKSGNEILMKMIWRHSNRMSDKMPELDSLLQIIDHFLNSNKDFLAECENILLKISLLHIKICVSKYSDSIVGCLSPLSQKIVKCLLRKDFELAQIREILRDN